MSRISQFTLASFAVVLSVVAACSNRDKVISAANDDPEMLAAIAKARDTLSQFWKVFENPEYGESGFSLKVKITDKRGTEFFWVSDIQRQHGKIMGTINNDPEIVASVKLGDEIEIPEADISDWLYMRDARWSATKRYDLFSRRCPQMRQRDTRA